LPHRCIYCNQADITALTDNDVAASIRKSLGTGDKACEVGLYGGNIFGIAPAKLEALFALFEPYRDRITNFRISTKPVPLLTETLEILKQHKVTVIEVGIPSFNDAILKAIERRHNVEDLFCAFSRLSAEGFRVALQVMAGLPGETMGDIEETAGHLIGLRPHYVRVYPLVVLRGTPLHGLYEKGLYTPFSFDEVLRRVAYLYLSTRRAGIAIVKMGLTDNEVIQETIAAGCYHPAFGYLVKSYAYYLAVKAGIEAGPLKGRVRIMLNHRDIPHLLGHKRQNMALLAEQGISVSWATAGVQEGTFILSDGVKEVEGSLDNALGAYQDSSRRPETPS